MEADAAGERSGACGGEAGPSEFAPSCRKTLLSVTQQIGRCRASSANRNGEEWGAPIENNSPHPEEIPSRTMNLDLRISILEILEDFEFMISLYNI